MGGTAASGSKASGGVGVPPPDHGVASRELEFARTRGGEVSLACTHHAQAVRQTPRIATVQVRFGVGPDQQKVEIAQGINVSLVPGRLVLLSGPSGSGKSSALATIKSQLRPPLLRGDKGGSIDGRWVSIDVQQITFNDESALIDEIAPDAQLAEAASMLTACGLGEPGLWLRPYSALSEGEKFRARLAKACCLSHRERGEMRARSSVHLTPPSISGGPGSATLNLGARIPNCFSVLLCDEFCSGLHRRAARAIAHNLRKLATRRELCIVAASSASDLTDDLEPDTVVSFGLGGRCKVQERIPRRSALANWRRKLRIEPGSKRDYDAFATMHYRSTDELGFVDRVFVLREKATNEALGIVVYAHAPLELALRNQATDGWFSKNPQRVNQHLRILRRLVIHPDVRGCGLGHYLVRKTMPLLGTTYVECLAAMGEFNPVFERAGMARVGQYDTPPGPQKALESLYGMDMDPQAPDFAIQIARRPAVRTIVAGAVADWYAATTGGGERRAERQSPEILARSFRGLIGVRPVYYLWQRTSEQNRKYKKSQFEPILQRKCKKIQRVARSRAVCEAAT